MTSARDRIARAAQVSDSLTGAGSQPISPLGEAREATRPAACPECGERPSNVVSITARHHLGT